MANFACPTHGLLTHDHLSCPRCYAKAFDVRDDIARAVLLNTVKRSEKKRRLMFGVVAAVFVAVAQCLVFESIIPSPLYMAMFALSGYAWAWILRPPAMHRLDQRIGIPLW